MEGKGSSRRGHGWMDRAPPPHCSLSGQWQCHRPRVNWCYSPPYLLTATSGWQRCQQPSPGNVHWVVVWQCGRNVSERSHRPFLFPLRPPPTHTHPKRNHPLSPHDSSSPPTHTGKQHNHSRPLQVQRHRRAQRCCQRQHYHLWWHWRYLGHRKRGGPGGFIAAA